MAVDNISQERVQTREEYKRVKASETQPAHAGTREMSQAGHVNHSAQERGEVRRDGADMRETRHAVQEKKAVDTAKKRPKERVRIRILPIWLRIVLLVVFTGVSLMAGAVVGYSVLGGGKTADVFSGSTWTHIRDLVEQK